MAMAELPAMNALAAWFHRLDRLMCPIRLDRGQLDTRPPASLMGPGVGELLSGSMSYASAVPALLTAAQADIEVHRGIAPSLDSIVVCHGAIGGLSAVAGALLKPGDKVLTPQPAWPAIADLIKARGASPVPYPFRSGEDVEGLLEALSRARHGDFRALIINAPSNPMGAQISADQAARILSAANRAGVQTVWDEAYETFTEVGSRQRILTSQVEGFESAILVTSCSKRFAAPGLRVGLVFAPPSIAAAVRDVCLLETGGVGRANQLAAACLLNEGGYFAESLAQAVAARRAEAIAALGSSLAGLGVSAGGIFVNLDARRLGLSGVELAQALLTNGIGSVPGELLGADGLVRLTLRTTPFDWAPIATFLSAPALARA